MITMDVFEQKKVLDSFEILVDTREQDTERAHKRYASFGVPIRRAALKNEFERARDHGCRIYLLCENTSWENLLNGKYRSRVHANAFAASVTAWLVRYNANLIFCKEETSGRLIREILYRDLKERLERGEFDEDCNPDR